MTNTANPTTHSPLTASLVAAVKAHAAANYEAGWDVVVETMDEDDIAERIGRARTEKTAIARVAEIVAVQVDRRLDVLSQSGEHEAEVAELVEASKRGRGRSKTGHPKADRVIADAKVEKAHEAALAKAALAKATPAKSSRTAAAVVSGPPAMHLTGVTASAKKAAPAKKTARTLKPATATIQAKVPAGYVPRYAHKSYDLYSTLPGQGKIQWLVVCNAHGTHTAATGGREGDVLGSKAGRQGWCAKCKTESSTAAGAAKNTK